MTPPHVDRYRQIIAHLATQALTDPQVTPSADSPLALARPVALAIVRDTPDPAATDRLVHHLRHESTTVRDGHGHTRPDYLALLLRLLAHQRPGSLPADLLDNIDTSVISTRLFAASLATHPTDDLLLGVADTPADRPAPLHPFVDGDELIDVWWFRELAAIHALAHLAAGPRPDLLARLRSAVLYHLHHTQPDHTTAQPWGVAAFAFFPDALPFADQQLHDAQANWTATGPAATLLPGLILADAAHTLAQLAKLQPTSP